jgi:AsmA protein
MKSSWLKKLLIGLGVLVLLIAATLTWLVATFDANAYKGVAIDWMKTERQRTLVIGGPVKLSVFPRLAVQVSGVTLSEAKSAGEFMALDEASLSVAVLPLLRQQVVVDRISARGLRVNYRRDEKGVANFDDLVKPSTPAEATPAPAPDKASQPLRFDVSGIQLDQVRLSLRDDHAKLAGDVTLNSFSTGRLADQVESPVKLDANVALTSPAVKGQLTGDTKLTLDLAAKLVKLRDMQLAWKGALPGVQAVDATLKGALAYDGGKGTLQADAVELKGGATLGALKFADSSLALQRFAFDPASKSIALDKLQVKLAGTQAGHPLALDLDWPQLAVRGESLQGSPLTGRVKLDGPTAVDASFQTAAPSGSFERIRVPGLQATLKGRSGPRELSGTVRADLQLQASDGSLTLDGLDTQLQIKEPSLQPLALTLKGKADASAQSAHWALNGQINANPFNTEGSAILATTPLTLKVAARFDALDLNRLLPAAAAAAASTPAVAPPAPDKPVDLSPLRALNGQFSLRIGQFAYDVYRVNDAVFDATLEGGMLRVTQLAGKTWGGSLNATAFADARASRVAVNATAQNVNIAAVLKDVARKDLLEGTGRVTLDVESAGRSVNELKSRLQGKAALQLRDGALKGINLAKKLREAKALIGMKQAEEKQRASQTEKTDFSELSASFAIKDGIARSTDLDMKSPFLRLGGDGLLDIGKGRIDYTARATVASTTKGQDGADLSALKGLTIPVRLTGPFEAIEWSIQWAALAGAALKSEIGSKAEDKLKEKLRDKLGLPAAAGAASGASAPKSVEDAAKDKLKDKLKGLFK